MATKRTMNQQVSTENEVVDINIGIIPKKRFRINGDDSRILELNTSDMNILSRLKEAYPKLNSLAVKMNNLDVDDTGDEEADITRLSETWESIDSEMRDLVDYIFQSNVSEVCAAEGSMYDPYNGKFRFEWIIDTLSGLYEQNMSAEFKLITERVQKHTDKYVKK